MERRVEKAVRGYEKTDGLRLVSTTVNGRSEMLPSDPHLVAKVLRERRSKSPAVRARTHILAGMRKRGIKA